MKLVTLVLFAAAAAGLTHAADDKKDDKKPPAGKVDWGAFADHAEMTGTVEKVGDTEFTLKVTQLVPGRSRRPGVKSEELELTFHDAGLVRWAKLPPKLDAKGKKVPYTEAELRTFKQPAGAPGYAADRTDLKPGAAAKVTVMRPKKVAADKLVTQDYRVKYVVLLGDPAKEPADKGDKKKGDEKKPAAKKDEKKPG